VKQQYAKQKRAKGNRIPFAQTLRLNYEEQQQKVPVDFRSAVKAESESKSFGQFSKAQWAATVLCLACPR
jgi:hypothetical protein